MHARIFFSQTCRDLRFLLRSKCYERLVFLGVLGDILPDHRLCTYCRTLHLVDHKDLPITAYDTFYKPCPAPEPIWSRHRLNPYYAIAHRHAQLAIKYTRLNHVHQPYRASILQKFTQPLCKGFFSMRLKFSAEPIVVHGRFILMTTPTSMRLLHRLRSPPFRVRLSGYAHSWLSVSPSTQGVLYLRRYAFHSMWLTAGVAYDKR